MTPLDYKDENSFGFSLFVDVRFKICNVVLIWIKHALLFQNTVEPPLTTTSTQWPPTATSLQWFFFFLADTVHTLNLVSTSLQWPPLFNGHFSPCGQSIHWLLCQPLYNGHLSTMATLLYRYWWDTRIFPYTKKSYLHRAQWRYYFYLSRVRILVSPWLLTWLANYCLYFSFITLYPSFITFLWQAFCDRWPL